VIFAQPKGAEIGQDGTLTSGIYNANVGCPTIVANNNGFVVIVRGLQPPSFGIQGYAVLNFNMVPPTIDELGEAQRPADEGISSKDRVMWMKNGLTLVYFGYLNGKHGGSINSPKPKRHKIFYDFDTGDVRQIN
jgi:hypothetical protein